MGETKRAVVVGVNEYEDKAIPALKGAEQDAQEVKEILEKNGGFEVAAEHFLLGAGATHDAIRGAISDVLWRTEPGSVTVFYFSGHGLKDSYGTGYLCPRDMEKARPLVHGIEMQGLRELALNSVNKEAVVLILDCCYAGVAADASAKGPPEAIDTATQCFSGIADVEPATVAKKGVFVFSSSASDQPSRELLGCQHRLGHEEIHNHGSFSFHLIEGLTGLAVNATDPTKHPVVSVAALRNYIEQEVNPTQTYELFCSRSSHPEGIILASATDVGRLWGDLADIKQRLESGDWVEVIMAAEILSRVLKQCPNFEPANDLRRRLDGDLVGCRQGCIDWITLNRMAMMQHSRKCTEQLEEFVVHLGFEQIAAGLTRRDVTLSWLVKLAGFAQRADSKVDELLLFLNEPKTATMPERNVTKLGGAISR